MTPPHWPGLAPFAMPARLPPLGDLEAAVLRILHAQRERYHCSQGALPLCLDLSTLAERLGGELGNIQRAISRLNAKLLAQSLIIICVDVPSLDLVSYALFRLEEIMALDPPAGPSTDTKPRLALVE